MAGFQGFIITQFVTFVTTTTGTATVVRPREIEFGIMLIYIALTANCFIMTIGATLGAELKNVTWLNEETYKHMSNWSWGLGSLNLIGESKHPPPWAPLPIFLAGARTLSGVTPRLSLRQEGRTRVEALVEGGVANGLPPPNTKTDGFGGARALQG